MKKIFFIIILLALFLIGSAVYFLYSKNRSLRGTFETSQDGRTYLSITDTNGGHACKFIQVDGKPWAHKIHEAGAIDPGLHKIECGGTIEFEIPAGSVFYFDYWGP